MPLSSRSSSLPETAPSNVEAQSGKYGSRPIWLDVGGVGQTSGPHDFCRLTTIPPPTDVREAGAPVDVLPGGVDDEFEQGQDIGQMIRPDYRAAPQLRKPRVFIHT